MHAQFRSLVRIFPFFVLLFFSCYKFVIKPTVSPPTTAEWPQFGASAARTGTPGETLQPPLELAWTYQANAAIETALTLVDSVLYFGSMDGYVYALDMVKGKKLGRRKTRIDATCAYTNHGLIIARRYGKETLYFYDLSTGKYRWLIDAGDIQTEPLLDGEWVYISALYKHVDRYNIATGNKSWTFETASQLHSTPALSRGILVLGSDDGTVYAIDSETGEQKWIFKTNGAIHATPVISNKTIYIGSLDNNLYALELDSGKQKWKFGTNGGIYHGCAVTDQSVIVGSNDHFIYCLDAATGFEQWKFAAKSLISTMPALTQFYVFFGSIDKHFYSLKLDSGELAWEYEAKGRIRTAPIVYGDYLFGASENNVVYAFLPAKSDSGSGK